jgi:hypothetical protein
MQEEKIKVLASKLFQVVKLPPLAFEKLNFQNG